VFTGTAPAAGAEWEIDVPGAVTWEVLAVTMGFVASVAVANRFPSLVVDNGAISIGRFPLYSGAITAGNVPAITAAPGLVNSSQSTNVMVTTPLPKLIVSAGWRLRSLTVNIDVGDQYGAPVLYVMEAEWGVMDTDELAALVGLAREG